jgi:Fic family protein
MEALGFKLRGEASLQTLTDDVVKSSEIEGEFLNREQVRSSIARRLGMDVGGLTHSDRNVDGVVEMVLDATQGYDMPLTEERLFAWHSALFPTGRSGMAKITVGAWRTDQSGPMQVISGPFGRERVHFQALPAARVEKEMETFLEWHNCQEVPEELLKAGIAHLWFVTIHPFDDGNGRIARAITDQTLAVRKTAVSAFIACPLKSESTETHTTMSLRRPKRAIWMSRSGWSGFLVVWKLRWTALKQLCGPSSRKPVLGKRILERLSMTDSASS